MIRAVDYDIATGVWPDMREHGWANDDWPAILEKILASDILVLAELIWLGDNSSAMKKVHERLYGGSHLLNDKGQYLYHGGVGGCLITGNEDGIKHCAQNVLYTLQRIGCTIPPQVDAGWDAGCRYCLPILTTARPLALGPDDRDRARRVSRRVGAHSRTPRR